jgi:putative transposase
MNSLYLIVNISRQGHQKAIKKEEDQILKEPFYLAFIMEIRDIHPGMGLRKIYNQFQPEGIGRDEFVALGLREGFRLQAPNKPFKTTYAVKHNKYSNLLVGKRFTDVNQIWVSDIFYFPLNERHYYGILIMDVYSRRIVGYSMADNMRAENNIEALKKALTFRNVEDYEQKLIHHSDRGSQYISDDYTNTLTDYGIQISVCANVLENAHSERSNGTIKNEYLNRWDIKDAKSLIDLYMPKAIDAYNNRFHNSIKMTPIEYELFLKTIPLEKRIPLDIFTIQRDLENPLQLKLDLK